MAVPAAKTKYKAKMARHLVSSERELTNGSFDIPNSFCLNHVRVQIDIESPTPLKVTKSNDTCSHLLITKNYIYSMKVQGNTFLKIIHSSVHFSGKCMMKVAAPVKMELFLL